MTDAPYETITPPVSVETPATHHDEADPFRYGWRFVRRVVDGEEVLERVPLTLSDLLHPQEEDEVMHYALHGILCIYLAAMLKSYLLDDPTAVVLFDVRVDLGLPGVEPIGPDIVVLFGVQARRNWGTFSVPDEGVCPSLVIEVTSPYNRYHDIGTRDAADAPKYQWYAQAGVDTYVVVDAARRKAGHAPAIYVYSLTEAGTYAARKPDAYGRLWLEPVGLWLGPKGDEVALYDAQGNELEDRNTASARAEAERTRAESAEARAESAESRADTERTRAESAEARAARLAEQLRKLGIAPEMNGESE
jgi:Uma2 family endonuclease